MKAILSALFVFGFSLSAFAVPKVTCFAEFLVGGATGATTKIERAQPQVAPVGDNLVYTFKDFTIDLRVDLKCNSNGENCSDEKIEMSAKISHGNYASLSTDNLMSNQRSHLELNVGADSLMLLCDAE